MRLIQNLRTDNLRGDVYGGITAAVVALPLALAFGVAAGAGPVAGVYGAIFVGFFAALFGGTPVQVSGPTGPMTVVMAAVFTQYTGMFPADPTQGAALAFTVVMLGGIFQILFGVFKLGRYINLVPHPVTSGFMSGIGVIIILLQLGPLLGHSSPGNPLAAAEALPTFLTRPVFDAVVLGIVSLAIVYLLPARLNRLIPSPLVALLVGTGVMLLFFPNGNASVLGEVPTGLPHPQLPALLLDWDVLLGMVKSGLVLALLGSIDSLLTSLVADNIARIHHDSNQELIGQGIGNTIAGLFGGLPGAGATMRTVVNVRAGGKTPLSGALHALILLAIILGAGGFAKYIPHAVLAGILIKVGTDIIDWDYLQRLRQAPKAGVFIMLTVFFITVFVDLITAVAVGMVMASFLFLQRMSDLQINSVRVITEPDEETPLSKAEADVLSSAAGRILLYHLEGPLSFGAAKGMVRILAAHEEYKSLVMDLSDVSSIDFTSCRALDDMISDALQAGREVFLAGARPPVKHFMEQQNILQKLPAEHIQSSRSEALRMAARSLDIDVESHR